MQNLNNFKIVLYAIFIFGSTGLLLFFFLNSELASKKIRNTKHDIIEKVYSDVNTPAVYIYFENELKLIILKDQTNEELEKAKYLDLQTSKGLFGFDVIRSKKLE